MTREPTSTPTLRLALAWLLVGVPLAWGIFETVLKALPLFR